MAGEWVETTLGEVSSEISYGYTESACGDKVGPKFLRITDIQGGGVDWSAVPYCPISREDHQKYRLHEGDIVIARTGNSTGENFLFRGGHDAVFASYLIRFRVDQSTADPRFVWYSLRTPAWWSFINNSKTGSAQAGANAKILGQYPVQLPPLAEQRAIAHILGTLDDKIELNRRMNETLEGMARALFKSWFVDFDPVIDNAQAAGNPIPEEFRDRAAQRAEAAQSAASQGRPFGLPKPLAAQFPNAFHDSDLGPIPNGWEVKGIGDCVEVKGGGTPSTKRSQYWDGGTFPFCTPRDMSSVASAVLLDTERHLTDAGVSKISSGQLPPGTLLLSSRAPIGYLAIAETAVSVNQGIIAMVCDKALSNHYILRWAEQNMDRIKANANGSTFLEISKKNFRPIPVIVPSVPVLESYSLHTKELWQRVVADQRQVDSLSALRDTLLPKLLSGELRVNDAEKFTEAAV